MLYAQVHLALVLETPHYSYVFKSVNKKVYRCSYILLYSEWLLQYWEGCEAEYKTKEEKVLPPSVIKTQLKVRFLLNFLCNCPPSHYPFSVKISNVTWTGVLRKLKGNVTCSILFGTRRKICAITQYLNECSIGIS